MNVEKALAGAKSALEELTAANYRITEKEADIERREKASDKRFAELEQLEASLAAKAKQNEVDAIRNAAQSQELATLSTEINERKKSLEELEKELAVKKDEAEKKIEESVKITETLGEREVAVSKREKDIFDKEKAAEEARIYFEMKRAELRKEEQRISDKAFKLGVGPEL